jgi:hypothetical protein
MKKNILIVLLSLNSMLVCAQVPKSFRRPTFELGTGIQISSFSGSVFDRALGAQSPVNELVPLYTITGSLNFPLKMLKEELYFGINPNLGLGYSYGNFQTTVPVYVTLKYGAAASKESQTRCGFGLGAGGYFSAFYTLLTSDYGDLVNYSSVYVAPSVMAEFSINTNRRGIYQIRTDFTPITIQKSDRFIGNIGQYNLRLMRTF